MTIYGDGEKLSIEPQVSDDGCVSYPLPTSRYNKLTVEYNLPTTVARRPIDYVQYRGDDFILIRPDIFQPKIQPEVPPAVTKIKLHVIPSENWDVITPGKDRFYDSTGDIFFRGYIIVSKAGAFFKYTKYTKHGTRIEIYVHKSIKDAYKIEKQTVKLFEYYENLFETPSPYGVYMVVFLPWPRDLPIWGGECQYGQAVSFKPNWGIQDIRYTALPHQMFHVWEGWPPEGIRGVTEANWQWEGINEYYVAKSLVNMNIIPSYRESPLIWYYDVYKDMRQTEYDVPVSEGYKYFDKRVSWSAFSAGAEIVYRKGALVAMLLDLEIQKATGGKKSLDDVEKEKFKEFRGFKKLYTNEDLLRIVNNVTGKDFSWFFEKYVWGTEKLPIDKYFEDYDNDGIINIDENSWRATIVYGDGRVDSEYARALKQQSVDNNLITDREEVPDTLFPLILVGGPLANNLTKFYLENHFNLSITNDYPGRGKGIIAVKNINGRDVIILAGSDRWGTRAVVELFGKMENYPTEILVVDWNNGSPIIVERIPWND
ncbi:S-layer protein [Thermococcus indicus]|uniref:S-layer protein n=1 Tax=Thermococcus indicus TaxID=2586643 RepID=A0A4Y5SJU9_9EURY|nr:S-layer protein [Thermococcus indicus]QDA30429.1 S-layer protein [Thermococcus indicus]